MIGNALHTLSAVLSPAFLQTAGRFHVVLVHFPIALLLLAGAAEAWRSVRRARQPSPLAIACLIVGAATAIASSALGWIHKGFTGFAAEGSNTLAIHQWLGIAVAVVAAGTLAIVVRLREPRPWEKVELAAYAKRVPGYRWLTIACAVLVGAAGHFGGTLTHGDGYLTELLFPNKSQKDSSTVAEVK